MIPVQQQLQYKFIYARLNLREDKHGIDNENLQTILLLLVALGTLYVAMKIYKDPPASAIQRNFIAVLPTLSGVSAFLVVRFFLPIAVSEGLRMYQLLALNVLPLFTAIISIVLLIKLDN